MFGEEKSMTTRWGFAAFGIPSRSVSSAILAIRSLTYSGLNLQMMGSLSICAPVQTAKH